MSEIITLRCIECENNLCGISNKYIPETSLEGCTRILEDEVAARYHHYMFEKWPQMLYADYTREHITQVYCEIIDFLETKIYTAPLGQKLNKRGKVSGREFF